MIWDRLIRSEDKDTVTNEDDSFSTVTYIFTKLFIVKVYLNN